MPKLLAPSGKKTRRAKDFTTAFTVDQSPQEVFAAIQNVRGWWSQALEGRSAKKGDEFIFRYPGLHYSKQRLTQVIPGRKMVWLVLDARLTFVENQGEWKGTRVVFEVAPRGKKTEVRFTHRGLGPALDCFDACSKGWTYYIQESLRDLITTGRGKPEKKWRGPGKSGH
ncbi:MAG TPA: SRPBCC domain-containing protein [bacterium]|nr:SRPBCC domain-containing protein [bacterium]